MFFEEFCLENWRRFKCGNFINFLWNYFRREIVFFDIEESRVCLVKKRKIGKESVLNNIPICIGGRFKESYGSFIDDLDKGINNGYYKVLNKKWVFKYIVPEVLDYVINSQNSSIGGEEISVFVREDSDVNIEIIKFLASKCKVLNVITDNLDSFNFLENYINQNIGIMINLTGNLKKGALRSGIVINLDYDNDFFRNCSFNRYSVVINFGIDIIEKLKCFDGIIINDFKIYIPSKYKRVCSILNDFSEEEVYGSFLYLKKRYDYIREEIIDDKIKIWYLIGNNGRVRNSEFLRVKKQKSKNNKKRKYNKTGTAAGY